MSDPGDAKTMMFKNRQASRRRPQMLQAHEHSGAFSNKMLTRKYLFSHWCEKKCFRNCLYASKAYEGNEDGRRSAEAVWGRAPARLALHSHARPTSSSRTICSCLFPLSRPPSSLFAYNQAICGTHHLQRRCATSENCTVTRNGPSDPTNSGLTCRCD